MLTDPIPVLTFDWSGKTELKMHNSLAIKTKSKINGNAQMVFMWWTLSMDNESKDLFLYPFLLSFSSFAKDCSLFI